MHRYLGGLAVVFTGVHVVSILADQYVHFGVVDVHVPLATRWRPIAVAWGIVAMYVLVAIQLTSSVRRHLAPRLWHTINLASYALFAISTVRMLLAGTDLRTTLTTGLTASLGMVAVFVAARAYVLRIPETEATRAVGPPLAGTVDARR